MKCTPTVKACAITSDYRLTRVASRKSLWTLSSMTSVIQFAYDTSCLCLSISQRLVHCVFTLVFGLPCLWSNVTMSIVACRPCRHTGHKRPPTKQPCVRFTVCTFNCTYVSMLITFRLWSLHTNSEGMHRILTNALVGDLLAGCLTSQQHASVSQ